VKAGVGTYGKVDSILFRWMKIISLLLHDMSNSIPVRAKLALKAEDYPWSSASAHLSGRDDMLVKVAPLLEMVDDWAEVLAAEVKEQELKARMHRATFGECDFFGEIRE
jgi:hypothetical protein